MTPGRLLTEIRASNLNKGSNLLVFTLVVATVACAQSSSSPVPGNQQGSLKQYHIKASELPAPFATTSKVSPPRMVPRPDGAELVLPPGFSVSTYAEGDFQTPRWMALAPNGDVFVSESRGGRITVLRDENGDGRVDERFVFATGLTQPFGMAFHGEHFYVANTNAVVRFKYRPGQKQAEGEPEKIVDLPGLGYRQHWTRNIIFSPDGSKMYVTVGSESNVDVEADPRRAAISEYNVDGSGHRIFAGGLRNAIGLAFQPGTNTLWAAVQERDLLGDDLVPDYVTSVKEGAFYGWPYCYAGQIEDPRRKGERPELVQKSLAPDVLIQAHSAVLGLVFYEGAMFPAEYRGDAFVAFHGSWNRAPRTGYKIVRIPFENGKTSGAYEDFISGWMIDENKPEVWGRPVGLVVLKDGSMLITDDGANNIWRVTYSAPRR